MTLQGAERHERYADLTTTVLADLASRGLSTREVCNILSLTRDRVSKTATAVRVDASTVVGSDVLLTWLKDTGLSEDEAATFLQICLKRLHQILGAVPFHESWQLWREHSAPASKRERAVIPPARPDMAAELAAQQVDPA